MATQKDLDVLKQKLRDLDAKLKSMGGGSARRNPNFDSAMAQQNYKNLMRDHHARFAAERGQFTQGRLNGAPTNQPMPPGAGLGGLTADEAGIPMDQRKIFDDLMARQGQLYPPGSTMPTDPNIGMPRLMPIPELGPPPQGPQVGGGMGGLAPQQPGRLIRLPSLIPQGQQMQNYQNFLKQGMQNSNTLNQGAMAGFANMQPGMQVPQAGGGMGGLAPQQRGRIEPLTDKAPLIPLPGFERQEAQQMQDYQNFLKQGMQNSNTLNQGAMAGFANMQPGMQVPQVPQAGVQVPQPGIGQTQGPNMTGMAKQYRRQNPALLLQRKFSTFNNKPANNKPANNKPANNTLFNSFEGRFF